MKKNKVFFIVACILTIVFSSVATFAISQGKNLPYDINNYARSQLEEDTILLAYSLAQEMDPNYEIISFDKNVISSEDEEIVRSALNSLLNSSQRLIDDSNFHYKATFKKTVDENKGAAKLHSLHDTNLELLIKNYLGWNYGSEIGYSINPLPKDFKFEYGINDPVINDGGYIAHYIDYESFIIPYILIGYFVPLAIICLFVVLFPYKEEKDAPLFRKVLMWKFEPFVAFNVVLISLLIMGIGLSSLYSLQSNPNILNIGIKANVVYSMIYTIIFTLWCMVFGSYFLILTYIKHIFCDGFRHFIHEDTWLFQILNWIRSHVNGLAQLDLGNHNKKKYVFAFVMFLFVLMLLFALGGLGFIIAVPLFVYLFIKFLHFYNEIQRDYKKTLDATQQIAIGNFDDVLPFPVGPFQSIYNELLKVKSGFEIALKKEIQSQNMKTELISNVSHDLKTPLTGIKTYVELLEDCEDIDDIKKYSKKIEGYTNRLDQLVIDLFDVSKANSGNIELNKQSIDLVSLIQQVQAEHIEEWEKKGLKVVYKIPEKATIDLDPNKTVRIFENLIGNITKYALNGTRVFIDIKEDNKKISIIYRNVSQQQLDFDPEEITERFVRGDKSRHEIGNGLGLAIVKNFTEIQGGNFKIEIDGDLFKAIVEFYK